MRDNFYGNRKAKVNGADCKTQFLSPESGQLKRVGSLDGGVRMDSRFGV